MMPRTDPFAALRVPHIGPLVLGRTVSDLGYQFVSVAVGWDLYERTHDPWALGLVGLVQIIPAFALTLPAGGVVDRFRRRDVAMWGHVILAAATFGLALVTWSGLPIQLVFAMLAVTGATRAFCDPAVNAIPPEILPPEQLANSYSWMVSGMQVATIGGPAATGLLIALTGEAGSSYLLATLAQLVFAVVLWRLPRGEPPAHPDEHRVEDLFAGIRFIRRNPIYLS